MGPVPGTARAQAYKAAFLAAALLALAACASTKLDIIQVGPWFPARDWREVEVFASRESTRAPWGGIGIIHSPRVGAGAGGAKTEKLKSEARKAAAAMGADGVIITLDSVESGPQMGVYQEPEVYISALAIKYVTAASTPTAK
ncbi:MAG: hypothetical protein A2081_04415 [Elusimicrobia bacterium GWC2_61_19]|nr:MAG: hypothetical protein A2081_04415 [Elusimicrobia bacterium GWC2_61_19]